ncbi:MAG: transglycosylase domain-containing protein [Lachnospiraceae bacterium]|nr:transglycosylase domain-containing protein [Lachnospiraceae bacterium]
MDFSKKGIEHKINALKSSSQKRLTKLNILFYRLIIVVIITLVFVTVFSITGFAKGLIDTSPVINELSVKSNKHKTVIYDGNGKQIYSVVSAGTNRQDVKIEDIPLHVQQAFVAIEDERFYEHNGIDIKGIFRALFVGLSGDFSEGASTITQQLIKNQVFEGGMESSFSAKVERKIQEQYLAVQLENKLDKSQILYYYLNTINLGAGTYGVEAASNEYFNKDVSELTISEAAVIASITQSPNNMNPITKPKKNAERREKVLKNMLKLEFITKEEYDEAMADDVYERIQAINLQKSEESLVSSTPAEISSYFVDALYYQVIEDLMNKADYDEDSARNLYYSGGLSIYTTLDSDIQNICDSVINDPASYPSVYNKNMYKLSYALSVSSDDGTTKNFSTENLVEYYKTIGDTSFDLYFANKEDATAYTEQYKTSILSKGYKYIAEKTSFSLQPQTSFVVIDQHNGQVKAIVGGRGEKLSNLTLNRATDSSRQPGSTFKVISTFLPALDTAGMTLATVHDDCEYYYPGTTKKVKSWRTYNKGLVSIREAIYDSNNVATVKTLADITTSVAFNYLDNLGFTTLDKNMDNNLSMALGGLTNGVTNLELTAAYSSIANEGIYCEPIFYTKILDKDGNTIIDRKAAKKQVMKETTSWLLIDAMKEVLSSYGTGTPAKFDGMTIAGKTGTTTNKNDIWFEGFTPYYTAGIWCGYDTNDFEQSDSSYHKIIWKNIMAKIHKNLEDKEITEKPSNIKTAVICTKCGKLAIDGTCNNVGPDHTDFTRTEYFTSSTAPIEYCTCHQKLNICNATHQIASSHCNYSEIVYLIKNEVSTTSDSAYIAPSSVCTTCTGETPIIIPPDQPQDQLPPDNPGDVTTNPDNPEAQVTPENQEPPAENNQPEPNDNIESLPEQPQP